MKGLSNYTLTEEILTGPAHALYRGYRNADQTPVFIKVLKGDYASVREIARLRHECAIAQEIDSPGILKAYGLEKVGHGLALVLEDIGGRPLNELLRAGNLDLGLILDIASASAEAIGALHDHHIIHKDIKPENIVIKPE